MVFNKKAFLRGISIGMTGIVLLGAGLLSGCTIKEESNSINNQAKDNNSAIVEQDLQNKIMNDFNLLIKSNPKSDEVITYIDKTIVQASQNNASAMLLKLEEIQKNDLPKLEVKYYSNETIQNEMLKVYMLDFDISKLDEIQNNEIKELITATRKMGFKIETAEGMFFPIINYEFYKKYSSYATADIKEYIEIMSVESNKTPIKDAALMIGWDEVIKRALKQEEFIKNYATSVKVEDIKQLQKRYLTFMLFGANNTPLFAYENNTMVSEAKDAYASAIKENQDSEMMQMLGKYMEVLSKTDYKFSDEADKFRKAVIEGDSL